MFTDIYLRSLQEFKTIYNLNLKITFLIYFVTKAYVRQEIRNMSSLESRDLRLSRKEKTAWHYKLNLKTRRIDNSNLKL